MDAGSAVSTIDSGLTERIAGRGRSAWAAQLRDLTAELARAFASAGAPQPRPEDAQAWQAMRKGFTDSASETPADNSLHPRIVCGDGARHGGDATTLQIALYACFEEIGSRIDFEGRTMVRTTALQQLQQLEDGARRKRLFLALTPLWTAVNGANTPDSPYRRMMALNGAAVAANGRSPISDAAATLGIPPQQVEQWLVQVLEAWQARSRGPALEPWDYWYASSGASRELSPAISRESVLPTAKRFYRDLGADLDQLAIRHDLDIRPGKAPLAYTDQIRIGRRIGNTWRPMQARVSANYEQGGLFVLNELIHEDGHAVHFAALRTRPAFFSLGDDLFFEAFADVPAWSSSEPAWQRKYLGSGTTEGAALRELFSNVMLDVAWGLFELRMLADPSRDPEPAVGRDHLALPQHHPASGVVMVGIAGPVGALAGLYDQLRTGRRPDRRHPSAHQRRHRPVRYGQSPLVSLDLGASASIRLLRRNRAAAASIPGPRSLTGGDPGAAQARRPQWSCSLASTSLRLWSSRAIASSTSPSSITSGGMKRTVL